MFCQECGTQMNDDALFCPKCGTKVVAPVAPESPSAPVQAANAQQAPVYAQPMNSNIITQPQGTAAKGNGGKIAIIVIVAAVLIAAVIGGCVLLFGNIGSGGLFSSEPKMWDILPEIDYTDVDDLEYHYDASLEGIVVDGYKLANPKVRIPDTIENEPVVGVTLHSYTITELIVPDTVKVLSFNSTSVKYINFPRELDLTYDGYSYYNNFKETSIEAVYIGSGVSEIPKECFYNCNKLEKVVITDKVKSIGFRAFFECDALESIVIPEGVTELGREAFEYCRKLAEVRLPSTLKEISNYSFVGCGIKSIVIPEGIHTIGEYAFASSSLTEIKFPNTLSRIEQGAFDHSAVIDIAIPKSVNYIGAWAFASCDDLKSVNISNGNANIQKGAFDYNEKMTLKYMGKTYTVDNIDELYTE